MNEQYDLFQRHRFKYLSYSYGTAMKLRVHKIATACLALIIAAALALPACGPVRSYWGVEGQYSPNDYYYDGHHHPPRPPKPPKHKKHKKYKKHHHHDDDHYFYHY